MWMRMLLGRMSLGAWLTLVGGTVIGLGLFLLLVKLMMVLAWLAEGVLLAGLATFLAGVVVSGVRRRRVRGPDDMPYF